MKLHFQRKRQKGKVWQQWFKEKARNLARTTIDLASSNGTTLEEDTPSCGKCKA
jgi:hypothetical protein